MNHIGEQPSSGNEPLRLSTFSWDGFVKNGGLFINLVGGALAGGIVLTSPEALPKWMISSVSLLFLSMALAFTRVWKTAREERETSGLWDQLGEVTARGSGMAQVKDAVFEIPYLFSMVFLPASVVSLQTFAGCLVLFYVADNYYNFALIRGIAGDQAARPAPPNPISALGRRSRRAAAGLLRGITGGRAEPLFALLGAVLETVGSIPDPRAHSIDRAVLARYFRRRAQLDRIAIWLLAVVFALSLFGDRDWAKAGGIVIVSTLLAVELLAEPFRALGLHYRAAEADDADADTATAADNADVAEAPGLRLLWTVPAGATLDEESLAALHRIHEEAFPPGERQYDVEFMTANAGRHGFLLLLLTEPTGPAGTDRVIGYVFLQARPGLEIAYFWYLAIDKPRRGGGLGRTMVSLALDVVRDRWPSFRAVFLESGPESLRFYRRLGFWRVRGVDYRIPVKGDPENSLAYEPMYCPLPGPAADLDDGFVRKAVLDMARDNFDRRRGDARWKALQASTAHLLRESPGPTADA